jgi:hypothetical protein
MNSSEFNEINQAVFGYSNGHRLLASSLKLSAVDVYELAAASDLAPGAQISGQESYLTGLMLPESRLYALVRTWLAPEMPRPGCVWSHVLLLGKPFLSTQVDLGVLYSIFRRPEGYDKDDDFTIPISVGRRMRSERPRSEIVEQVLLACYENVSLGSDQWSKQDVERAVLSVWSQQWPRMRTRFAFRSIPTVSRLKGQFFEFGRDPLSRDATDMPEWVEEATRDIVSNGISPLRRFLWRYGKDVNSDKNVLPDLTTFYLGTRGGFLGFATADNIFEHYVAGQADTLKRDVLGLSASKLSLVPSLQIDDLMQLLVRHWNVSFNYDEKELASLFSQVGASQVPAVADTLMSHRHELGERFDLIMGAVLPSVTHEMLVDASLPYDFALAAVFSDPSLLDAESLRFFSTEDVVSFGNVDLSNKQRHEVLQALLSREHSSEAELLSMANAGDVFFAAVGLDRASRLHESWRNYFRSQVQQFLEVFPKLQHGDELIAAAKLFGFPADPEQTVRPWYDAFQTTRSSLHRKDETRFLVYLLALCVRHNPSKYHDILMTILNPLRERILNAELPKDAEEMLGRWLPDDDARWDLNRRLLKLFRKAKRRGADFSSVLESMHLSMDEFAYATGQDPENLASKIMRAFTPWGYGD